MSQQPEQTEAPPQFVIGAEYIANPYPVLAMLRGSAPVFRYTLPNGGTMWFITRFDDAIQALKDLRISSRAVHGLGNPDRNPDDDRDILGLNRSMVFTDEPDHARLRTLVSKGFTPRLIENLRPRIEQITNELLDQVQDRGQMDVMTDFAYPLPINVISEMLGVPHEDHDKIRRWSEAMSGHTNRETMIANLHSFAEYIQALIVQKRAQPTDDFISSLAAIGGDPDRLSEHELLGMVSLLIFAGHETTSNLIGNGLLALLSQRTQWEALKADPSLIPNAIEELLRYCGPALSTGPRVATTDIEIGGQIIRSGDMVNVVVGSADRDSTMFTDPETLNVARQVERHLAFGHGIHYCLGAPLARLEGQIAFGALLRRMPNIQLAVDPTTLTWHGSIVLRGLADLPVTF